MSALHLYGFTRGYREPDGSLIGLDGRPVSAISHRDLTALVSPASNPAYTSMAREAVVRYLFSHQAVLEQVMTRHTVIPVKFGTTARDEAETQKILESGRPRLIAALEAMEGKVELDLVAQWHGLNWALRQIAEDPEIGRLKAAAAASAPEDTVEARVMVGQLVKARLDRIREERAAEIVATLKPLTHDLCPHALLEDRMILNTAFLVEQAMAGEVGVMLERLSDHYGDRIDFRCVGPLPPYSFATVEVKTFEFEEIDRSRRLLELRERATLQEVKDAYRKLVHQCHPDKVGERAVRTFEAVTEASRLLGEYCRVGSSFHASDVSLAVAVRLLQWPREPVGACGTRECSLKADG